MGSMGHKGQNMKIIIIGGSGFVGQNLVRHLDSQGHAIRIYDKRVPVYGSGFCGDIEDLDLLVDAVRDSDLVYHLASNAEISKAITDPTVDFYEGTLLTQNVLEAMRITGVKRLVYFSGSGVYGEDANAIFGEDHAPMLPISTYGASKLACEAMICAYCKMFGLTARVLRPANIVGPYQTHGVGFDFMRRLKDDPTQLRVLGDGTQSKSYIHISDVLMALEMVEKWNGGKYEVFNMATDDYITVEAIALMACRVAGANFCAINFTGGDRGWKGDVPVIRLNCGRLKALGWTPKMGSDEAIAASLRAM